MGRMRSLAKGLAVVACMLFFVHCGEIEAPETGETLQVSGPEPQVTTTWVSCLPPQWDPPALPEFPVSLPSAGTIYVDTYRPRIDP